jgi:flagellar assembly protein FliH
LSKPSFSSETPPGATAKKFTPSLFPEGESPSKSFQSDAPELAPARGIFPFGRSLRDLEDRILKNVKDQALQIEKEAYEKGFAQGEKDGQELGLKRFEATLQSFQKILGEMQTHQKEYNRIHEGEMVRFLLALARRVLRQEFPHAEETVAETLREAIRQVEDRKKIRIRLHPKDYEFLKAHPERLPIPLQEENPEGAKLVADPALLRGGCLIETPFGDVDATLESQLDQIAAGICRKIDPGKNKFPGSAP